ncbi:uncharacterized protein LOC126984056 [Eriocheir sinensis]|uniref:uncharacterized protein LOC126984056 n=1 Tax=Eriocheir sinensis TaxID=95602 RepID=UPI0021C91A07|nr:uncharacterized protein LOC126984056 [Eriocheir sinensis]
MVHWGLPWRGQYRPVVVSTAVLLAQLLQGVTANRCADVECEETCDESDDLFHPQKCDDCCSHTTVSSAGSGDEGDTSGRMDEMETALSELRVMVGVLLALMVLLLVGVVALLLRLSSSKGLKVTLPVFFRSKDEGRASIEKHPPPPSIKVPNENRNSTVVRIADYQNNHSPLNRRMRPNGQAVHEHSMAGHNLPSHGERPRARQPSESTCPDDSTELPHPHQHAYDNLALSTSTLHDTTTSSTSTLGPAVSTNTLDTTLPSVNPTTPVLRSMST